MQVGIDVKCMHTNLGGRGCSSFGDFGQFFLKFVLRSNFHFAIRFVIIIIISRRELHMHDRL